MKDLITTEFIIPKNKTATNIGFMQVGLDVVTSANCKSKLWFGLDKQLSTLVLKFNFIFFNRQRLWADGILIPNLYKALAVTDNFKSTHLNDLWG